MDIPTLALTALTLAKPFLEKTQEGMAKKIGEEIWTFIKKPFAQKTEDNVAEELAKSNEVEFTRQLEEKLRIDPEMVSKLTEIVNQAQTILNGNLQQNINSYEKIEKQVNIQNNTGNIQM